MQTGTATQGEDNHLEAAGDSLTAGLLGPLDNVHDFYHCLSLP